MERGETWPAPDTKKASGARNSFSMRGKTLPTVPNPAARGRAGFDEPKGCGSGQRNMQNRRHNPLLCVPAPFHNLPFCLPERRGHSGWASVVKLSLADVPRQGSLADIGRFSCGVAVLQPEWGWRPFPEGMPEHDGSFSEAAQSLLVAETWGE